MAANTPQNSVQPPAARLGFGVRGQMDIEERQHFSPEKLTLQDIARPLFYQQEHPMMKRLQLDGDVDTQMRNLQKEQHERRLKQLRQLAKTLPDDDWRYTPVEKLIGLQ